MTVPFHRDLRITAYTLAFAGLLLVGDRQRRRELSSDQTENVTLRVREHHPVVAAGLELGLGGADRQQFLGRLGQVDDVDVQMGMLLSGARPAGRLVVVHPLESQLHGACLLQTKPRNPRRSR